MASTATRPKSKRKKLRKRRKSRLTAATCDIHDLYEKSVQEPEVEVEFIDQVWNELRGRRCLHIREDFCGTAAVCREWVKRREDNTALGVDIDASVLAWARGSIETQLPSEQAQRVELLEANVLTARAQPAECVLAMNFSYYLLKTRPELVDYFRRAYANVADGGLFLLDAYGGSDSFLEMEEDRELEGFTYIWDQNKYDPITGHATNYIHFHFPDGTKIKRAFAYDWRLWTLPEVRECLVEAGFRDVIFYWEGTDEETDEGNGEWTQATCGEACPGWVAYIVGVK